MVITVKIELDGLEVSADLSPFLVVYLVVLDVILIFLDVSGWKLPKVAGDLMQVRKGNTYLSDIFSEYDKIKFIIGGSKNEN